MTQPATPAKKRSLSQANIGFHPYADQTAFIDQMTASGVVVAEVLRLALDDYIACYNQTPEQKKVSKLIRRPKPSAADTAITELAQQEREATPTRGRISPMERKLASGDCDEFDHKDWLKYMKKKAAENGLVYTVANQNMANAVVRSIMKMYKPVEIRNMIDFLYESGQTRFNVAGNAVMGLSKAWLDYTYTNSLLWKDGKFHDNPKAGPIEVIPSREWNGPRKTIKSIHKGGVHI